MNIPNIANPRRLLGVWLFCAAAVVADAVTLSWSANSEPNLAGYRLHYGTASAPYANTIEVSGTSASVSELMDGVTYTFAVSAYNTEGAESPYSEPVSHTVGSSHVIPTAILANISTRSYVQTGEDVMIGGFIVEGVLPKKVALRALGPSLGAAGVPGAMADPVLKLVDAGGAVVASNDNWNVPGQEVESYGLAPSDAREAALVTTLPPGAYSAIVSGQGNSVGVGMFELYDLAADLGRAANISTRSRVETGDQAMIGGFIISGTTANKVIVRAIGPSLTALGVAGALKDPTLELYDSSGTLVNFNDNWRSAQESEIIDSTVAPTDNHEAAIIATLAPGAYTAVVRGANDMTGVALVEVYALN